MQIGMEIINEATTSMCVFQMLVSRKPTRRQGYFSQPFSVNEVEISPIREYIGMLGVMLVSLKTHDQHHMITV